MGKERKRLEQREKLLAKIEELDRKADTTLIIHYSCESFYDRPDGGTPRITSIAVSNLASGQTKSFSIHKIAEQEHIPIQGIDSHYDSLERKMLDEFFEFAHSNKPCSWVHWNMRDINYGFEAIEHRYKVLGQQLEHALFSEEKKFDLSRALGQIYGKKYISHPRLETLVDKNGISRTDFLSGAEEAEAFEKGEYVKLHQSTLRKSHVLSEIFQRVADRTLETDAKWLDIHGLNPSTLVEYVREHWIFKALGIIAFLLGLWRTITLFF